MSLLDQFTPAPVSLLEQFRPDADVQSAQRIVETTPTPETSYFSQGLRSAFLGMGAGDLYQKALEAEQNGDKLGALILRKRAEDEQLQAAAARGNVPTWDQSTQGIESFGNLVNYARAGAGQGLGSMVPSILPAMLPLGKLGRFAAAAYPSYNMNRGEQVGQQYADPAQAALPADDRALNASLYAGAAAIPDAIAPASIAAKMLPGSRASAILGSAGPTMAFEGTTEAVQNKMSDYAQNLLNPEHAVFSPENSAEDLENYRLGVLGAGAGNAMTLPGQLADTAGQASLTAGMDLFNKAKDSSVAQTFRDKGAVGVINQGIDAAADGAYKVAVDAAAISKVAEQIGWGEALQAYANKTTGNNPVIDKIADYASKLSNSAKKALFGAEGMGTTLREHLAQNADKWAGITAGLESGAIDAKAIDAAQTILDGEVKDTDANTAAQRVMDGSATKEDVQVVLVAGELAKAGKTDINNTDNYPSAIEAAQKLQNDPATAISELGLRIRKAVSSAINLYDDATEIGDDVAAERIGELQKYENMTPQQLVENHGAIGALVRNAKSVLKKQSALKELQALSDSVNAQSKLTGVKTNFSKALSGNRLPPNMEFASTLYSMISNANPEFRDGQGYSENKLRQMVSNVVGYLNHEASSTSLSHTSGSQRTEVYNTIRKLVGRDNAAKLTDELFHQLSQGDSKVASLGASTNHILYTNKDKGADAKARAKHSANVDEAIRIMLGLTAPAPTKQMTASGAGIDVYDKGYKQGPRNKLPNVLPPAADTRQARLTELIGAISKYTGTDRKIVEDAIMLRADPVNAIRAAREFIRNDKAVSSSSDALAISSVAERIQRPENADGEVDDSTTGDVNVVGGAEAGVSGGDNQTYYSDVVSPVQTLVNPNPGGKLVSTIKQFSNQYDNTHNVGLLLMTDWADEQLDWTQKRDPVARNAVLQSKMDEILKQDQDRLVEMQKMYTDLHIDTLKRESKNIYDQYKAQYPEDQMQSRYIVKNYADIRERQREFVDRSIQKITDSVMRNTFSKTSTDPEIIKQLLNELYWINAREGTAKYTRKNAAGFFATYDQYRVVKASPMDTSLEQFSEEKIALYANDVSGWQDNVEVVDGKVVVVPPTPEPGHGVVWSNADNTYIDIDIAGVMSERLGSSTGVSQSDVLRELTNLDLFVREQYGSELRYDMSPKAPIIRSPDGKVVLTLEDFMQDTSSNPFAALDFSKHEGIIVKDPIQRQLDQALADVKRAHKTGDIQSVNRAVRWLKAAEEDSQNKDTPAVLLQNGILRVATKRGRKEYISIPTLIAHALNQRDWTGNTSQLSKATQAGLLINALADLERRGYTVPDVGFDNPANPQNPYSQLLVSEGLVVKDGVIGTGKYESSTTLKKILDAYNKSDFATRPLMAGQTYKPTFYGWAVTDLDIVANKIARREEWLRRVESDIEQTEVTGEKHESPEDVATRIATISQQINDIRATYGNYGNDPAGLKAQRDKAVALEQQKKDLLKGYDNSTGRLKQLDRAVADRLKTMMNLNVSYFLEDYIESILDEQDFTEKMFNMLIRGPEPEVIAKVATEAGGAFVTLTEEKLLNDPITTRTAWKEFLAEYLRNEIEALKGLEEISYVESIRRRTEHVPGQILHQDSTAKDSEQRAMKYRKGIGDSEGMRIYVPAETYTQPTSLQAEGDSRVEMGEMVNHNPLASTRSNGGPQYMLTGDDALITQFGPTLNRFMNDLVTVTQLDNGQYTSFAGQALVSPDIQAWKQQPGKIEAMLMVAKSEMRRLAPLVQVKAVAELHDRLNSLVQNLTPLADPNYSVPNPLYKNLPVGPVAPIGQAPLGRSELRMPTQDRSGTNATSGATAERINDDAVDRSPIEAEKQRLYEQDMREQDAKKAAALSRAKKGNYSQAQNSAANPQEQITMEQLVAQFQKLANGLEHARLETDKQVTDEQGVQVPEFTSFDPETQQHIIKLNSQLEMPAMLENMYHGSVHMLINALQADASNPNGQKVAAKILKVATAKPMMAKIESLLTQFGNEAEVERIRALGDPSEYAAYMYQFSMLSDENGPLISIGRDTSSALELLKRFFAWVFRMTTDTKQVQNFLDQWSQGNVDLGNMHGVVDGLQRKYMDQALDNVIDRVGPIAEAVSKIFSDSTTRMRKMNHPVVNQIADWYSGKTGKRGFESVHHAEAYMLANDLSKKLGGLDNKESEDALREVLSGEEVTSEKGKALWAWMEAHDMIHDGRPELVWDMDIINANPDAFMHDVKNRGWARVDDLSEPQFAETGNRVVNMLIRNNLAPGGGGKTMHDMNSIEGMYGIRVHPLPGMHKHLAKYMQADPSMYFPALMMRHAKVKAQMKVFGTKVNPDGKVVADLTALENAINDIAHDSKLSSSQKKEVSDFIAMMEGRLGANLSPELRTAQNWALTAANVVTLPLAIFSQLVEPMSIAARSGNIGDAFSAMAMGIGGIPSGLMKSTPNSHEYELSSDIGMIERDSIIDNMQYLQNGVHMSGIPHKISKFFFRWNLMEGWHRSQHAAAVGAGERYILSLRNEPEGSPALAELGLSPSDIAEDANGYLALNEKTIDALHLFVHSAIAVPSKSNTAIWMNDERFALLGHMKRFQFAFHADVLSRAFDQYKDHKNAVPLAILAGAIPIALAAGGMKHILKGTSDAVSWGEAMTSAVQNSSLLGKFDFAAQAVRDVNFGRPFGFSMLGPAIGLASDVAGGRGI